MIGACAEHLRHTEDELPHAGTGVETHGEEHGVGELHVTTLPGTPGFISIFSRELSKGPEEGVRLTIRRAREEHVLRVVALLGEGMRYGTVRPMDSAVLASTLFDVALPVCSYAGQHRSSAAIRDSM